jgi:hypothetical protein
MDKEQIIREYQQAYELANGKAAPVVTYNRGWFRVGHPSSPHRASEILRFRDVLLERAAKAPMTNGERE